VYPVRYELGFYIPEDYILHSHRREHLKSFRSSNPSQCYPICLQRRDAVAPGLSATVAVWLAPGDNGSCRSAGRINSSS
jgi:hypothetical protein